MKPITSWQRLAVVSFLLGAFMITVPVFNGTESGISSLAQPITHGPTGVIETDGTLDSTFNSGRFTNGLVSASVLQPDGKLLIGGQFSQVHGVARFGIARLNTDGTLDLSFDAGLNGLLQGMTLQTDGKIIIFGSFQTVGGVSRPAGIARLNSDGSLDSGFDPGRVISYDGLDDGNGNATNPGRVSVALLQADGKVVALGQFFFVVTGPGTNVARSCVARFNSDGTFDGSYNPGAGAVQSDNQTQTTVYYTAQQNLGNNAGKVIISGFFDTFDGHPVPSLARLNSDGSFDATFTPGTAAESGGVVGLFVQSDDKIFAVGVFTSFNGVACTGLVRLDTSGAVDSGFSPAAFEWYGAKPGEYTRPTIFAVAEQPDGKLIVTGEFHSIGGVTANNVVRLETNGARDASFSGNGAGPSAWQIDTALVRPKDGKIFLGGYFSTFGGEVRNNMAWANADGTLDNSFAGLDGATEYFPNVWALATQADGKVVLTGLFTSFDGASHNNVLRLNSDGTLDSSFDVNTDRSTRALLIQPDGKILIAGNFGEVSGVPIRRIARLNSDGTLDPSFDPGTGPDNYIYALAQDSAGNIYAGGVFESVNGVPRPGMAKLNPNGTLDLTFNPGGGDKDDPFVFGLALSESDGNIVIGGQFSTYAGANTRGIARLNTTTGAIDSTFNHGGFNGTIRALLRAPDGKYYAGGSINAFGGVQRRRIARLNDDGSLDTSFVGPMLDGTVYALALQNGKIFAGGTNSSGNVVRLTDTGALDSSFVTGTGFDISPPNHYALTSVNISTLGIQADGKLLAGGIFNQYNGTARICIARLTGPLPTPSPTPTPAPPATLGNISTRLKVETGDNALIGGFIVTGTQPKKVIVRAIGPSLPVADALTDPILELRDSSGVLIQSNDNWRSDQEQEIIASMIPPANDLESAIVATLPANSSPYTAIVRGVNNGTGVGLVEVYDLDQTVDAKLANISTRGLVQTEGNDMIAGTIVLGQASQRVLVRAIGPSLPVAGKLADPTLELRDGNGGLIRSNDNWRSEQEADITATTIPPTNDLESAILETLPANGAAYTAIVRGVNNTSGVALVEVYGLP